MCKHICRYHMFGEDVHRLRVLLSPSMLLNNVDDTVVFQKDGNYGDTWNYGQVTLNLSSEATVSNITQEVLSLGGGIDQLNAHIAFTGDF